LPGIGRPGAKSGDEIVMDLASATTATHPAQKMPKPRTQALHARMP
jgi:hypothetical protein